MYQPGAPSAYAVDWDFSEFVDFSDFAFLSANFGRTTFDGTLLLYPAGFPSQVLSQGLNQGVSQFAAQTTDSAPEETSSNQASSRRYSYAMSSTNNSGPAPESTSDELAAVDQLFQSAGQTSPSDSTPASEPTMDAEAVTSDVDPVTAGGSTDGNESGTTLNGALDPALSPTDLAENG